MNEDLTQKLPDSRSFEERVLSELAAIRSEQAATRRDIAALDSRLTALEDKVDARLRETRPIRESMQQQLTEMATRMAAMEKTLDLIQGGWASFTAIRLQCVRASPTWNGASVSASARPQVKRAPEARITYHP